MTRSWSIKTLKNSHPGMSYKEGLLKNFSKFVGNTIVPVFYKIADWGKEQLMAKWEKAISKYYFTRIHFL